MVLTCAFGMAITTRYAYGQKIRFPWCFHDSAYAYEICLP